MYINYLACAQENATERTCSPCVNVRRGTLCPESGEAAMVASATEVSSRVIISVSFPVKLLKRLTVCLLPRPWAAKPPEVPSDAESPAIRISTLFSSHCRRRGDDSEDDRIAVGAASRSGSLPRRRGRGTVERGLLGENKLGLRVTADEVANHILCGTRSNPRTLGVTQGGLGAAGV